MKAPRVELTTDCQKSFCISWRSLSYVYKPRNYTGQSIYQHVAALLRKPKPTRTTAEVTAYPRSLPSPWITYRSASQPPARTHSAFFHTSRPRTQVLSTLPLLSSTTRSASAPGLRVPFRVSIPRHFAGLYVAQRMASPREQPVKREKLRTHLSRVMTLWGVGL